MPTAFGNWYAFTLRPTPHAATRPVGVGFGLSGLPVQRRRITIQHDGVCVDQIEGLRRHRVMAISIRLARHYFKVAVPLTRWQPTWSRPGKRTDAL